MGFDYVWVCKMEAASTVKWRCRTECYSSKESKEHYGGLKENGPFKEQHH